MQANPSKVPPSRCRDGFFVGVFPMLTVFVEEHIGQKNLGSENYVQLRVLNGQSHHPEQVDLLKNPILSLIWRIMMKNWKVMKNTLTMKKFQAFPFSFQSFSMIWKKSFLLCMFPCIFGLVGVCPYVRWKWSSWTWCNFSPRAGQVWNVWYPFHSCCCSPTASSGNSCCGGMPLATFSDAGAQRPRVWRVIIFLGN